VRLTEGARAFLDRVGKDGWDPVLPASAGASGLEAALKIMRTPGERPASFPWDGRIHEERTGTGVPLRIYRPAGSGPRPIVVFMHGGGWVLGDLDTYDNVCRRLAQAGPVVVSVGYRLAPEHPFPAPLDDCAEAVRWAGSQAGRIGGDASRITVMGSSAGGNLAAALAIRARTDPTLPVSRQVLLYPVLDSSMSTPSYRDFNQGYFLSARQMAFYWDCYVPDASARQDPEASPMSAASLDGLAPALIIAAQADPLRDEARRYARRLSEAGVPVRYRECAGMIHGFLVVPGVPEIDFAIDETVRAVMLSG
jgi:acetyl esterase